MLKAFNMRKITFAAALLLTLCLIACRKDAPQTGEQAEEKLPELGQVLSALAAAPVKIEVFSDLQCPSCRELFLRTIQPTIRDYPDKVSVIYYEFPLSMHPYAHQAARYVAAAAKLGQRQALSVYEAIFNEQANWAADGNLEEPVSKALSLEDFMRVVQTLRDPNSLDEINKTIGKEQQLGRRRGVNSTPTMFITNGGKEQKVEGSLNYQVMKQFLDPIAK